MINLNIEIQARALTTISLLFFASFFMPVTFAQEADINIFTNGAVMSTGPKLVLEEIVTSDSWGNKYVGENVGSPGTYCSEAISRGYTNYHEVHSTVNINKSNTYLSFTCMYLGAPDANGNQIGPFPNNHSIGFKKEETKKCPPEGLNFETFTYPYAEDGDTKSCHDPINISMNDSCNVAGGNEFLTVPFNNDKPSGCFRQNDGSMCKYDSVSFDNGAKAYAMDLEGDCYDKDQHLPEITEAPMHVPDPDSTDNSCNNIGGNLVVCPEDPADVCSATGSSYGGTTADQCQVGCGTVNDVFVCLDTDIDNDTIPDYLDPDMDGDGIRNEDDLDNNGDGQDDPIDNSNNGQEGEGDPVTIDTSALEGKLDGLLNEIKKKAVKQEKKGFDTSAAESELQEIKAELDAKLTSIEAEAKTLIPAISGGGGSFNACFDVVKMGGTTHNRCLDSFSDEMLIISNAVLFLFTVIAAFILLRGNSRD